MKLKDVTNQCQLEVSILKHGLPNSEVKIYERGPVRFVYTYGHDSFMLSISSLLGKVLKSDWMFGLKEILNMDLLDVMINVTPRNIVIIKERPHSIPRVANCTK
ncbi:hypothetical protein F9U64_18870 [Gracilibacillus oryzae]|uniref:Uncharacterized protein n=1 Tax=Gracilibacillus oryzae TaxID=1672701 RepID=A0A7C8KMV1_9BACI|nr:hypothetical protein [Gracilibacillus oryzae]KAB8126885.1 hypothetical protein F9U64_18870 [Gracilibacillus oryzae]